MDNPIKKDGVKIAKFISDSDFCSRRAAEKLVTSGRVKIGNEVVTNPATRVLENVQLYIDDQKIYKSNQVAFLWLYHKPKGLITSHNDPQNRKTVFAHLPDEISKSLSAKKQKIISIGRLDLNTEGLLLLTNSGKLSRFFELPENNFIRKYKVRVYGKFTKNLLQKLNGDIQAKDKDGKNILYKNVETKILGRLRDGISNFWLEITIKEGRNREVRNICENNGLQVSRLIRTQYGDFKLGELKPGKAIFVERSLLDKYHF